MDAVVVQKVSKVYTRKTRSKGLAARIVNPYPNVSIPALQEVSLHVRDGEIYGLVGASKAGKTTLLRIIAGMLRPDTGSVKVFGYDSISQFGQVQRLVNPVGLDTGLLDHLTPLENLVYGAKISGIHTHTTCENGQMLLAQLGLGHTMVESVISDLPGLVWKKTALARALMSPVRVLLLDDPLIDFDKVDRMKVGLVLQSCSRTTGRTIILASRNVEDALTVCDRYSIMEAGSLTEPEVVVEPRFKRAKLLRKRKSSETLIDR